ncbi:MAG: GNAT family N-acetyltransferase [Chloroflexota bacterium]|nr:GNAT family N-acetyltransferase [Chloroflexota bacterium]
MTCRIRLMGRDDKRALMRILRATPEFKAADVAVAEEVLDSYLADPVGSGYQVMVAQVSGTVVGYVCCGPTPLTDGTWDIYWLAVEPHRQGQGIGGTLLACAEEKARQARGRLALIETSSRPEYERTRRFHCSHGYHLICRIPDFYAPEDDKLVFQKRLCGESPGTATAGV